MSEDKAYNRELVEKVIELGKMLLAFGLVERATYHEDQTTAETDTTHTVMLGIMASAYASKFAPYLDTGKIAQFALVHDLVEVYAGDTISLGKKGEDTEKKEREEAALARIHQEYGEMFPWIPETIEAYEKLSSPEARFVKVFDKVLPKIVHLLTKGVTVKELGHTRASMIDFHEYQFDKLGKTYGADQKEAMELLALINAEASTLEIE